ncbi:MAG: hypothetical protein DI598_16825 [Pseudopedobacter saltans]|uniref:DUF6819 domain-containing protein n=1 Tax=Pseudopedobacter saltans TaxID=151895 RepID=A0A2W5GAE2_9SPHI|nr:MAG: hypothetical protein DI598_16825 [Pseudopedobacter saltans]
MLARGNYANELNIPIPFSLVSINDQNNNLEIMVGYWFLYNMYALTRNSWKYANRDERIQKTQYIEYDYLAPDTVEEILQSMQLIETAVGNAYIRSIPTQEEASIVGKKLLEEANPIVDQLEIVLDGIEHSNRKTVLTKCLKGYQAFASMLTYYGLQAFFENCKVNTDSKVYNKWLNVGGQLIPKDHVDQLRIDVVNDKLGSWDAIHQFYEEQGALYPSYKIAHGLHILEKIKKRSLSETTVAEKQILLDEYLHHEKIILEAITISRKKDYTSPFRKMMYDSEEEMNEVLGSFEDNSFILQKKKDLLTLENDIERLKLNFNLH